MKKIPHQLTENVKLLHKVVLVHQEKFLILKRAADSKSRPNNWDLAGGNSEWPEVSRHGHGVHQSDVAREVMEETGIKVPKESFDLSRMTLFDTFFDADKQIFTVICGWKYELPEEFDENSVQISDEHSDYKWIVIDKLDNYDFGGEKGEFVKRIIKGSKKINGIQGITSK